MVAIRKKRKYDLGRPAAMTKLGPKRIHLVRTMGGNQKHRALRLETGNFSWGSEVNTRKTRILNVVYNASSNELVRTNTLVKNCIVHVKAKLVGRKDAAKLEGSFEGQFAAGRLYACIS